MRSENMGGGGSRGDGTERLGESIGEWEGGSRGDGTERLGESIGEWG